MKEQYILSMAQEGAKSLLWFLLLVFIAGGLAIWHGMNEDRKGEQK